MGRVKNTARKTLIIVLVLSMMLPGISPASIQAEAATVKLNKTTATMTVGDTLQLKVKNTSKSVTWKSSNKKVASVSKKGKVTAKKAGTVTITAKVGKKKLTCEVTVKKKRTITLSTKNCYEVDGEYNDTSRRDWRYNGGSGKRKDKTVTLYVGESLQLKLKGVSGKNVTWKSSNKKVATVSKTGKIKTKKAGVIYVDAKYGKQRYTVCILVKLNDTITIKQDEIILSEEEQAVGVDEAETDAEKAFVARYEGEDKYTAQVNVCYASGAKYNYDWYYLDWSSDDEEIATVDWYGVITLRGYGTTTIRCKDQLSGTEASVKVTCKSLILEDIDKKINDVLDEIITEGMTDAEKVLAVFDWLCFNTKYGYAVTVGGEYDVLFNGIGVCEAYSQTFAHFMNYLDIPCVVVRAGTLHSYNQVQLEGKWYWLDVQAADSSVMLGYTTSTGICYGEFFLSRGYRSIYKNVNEGFYVYNDFNTGYSKTDWGEHYTYEYDQDLYGHSPRYDPHTDGIILP